MFAPGDWQLVSDYGTSALNKLSNSGRGFTGTTYRGANFTDSQVKTLFPEGGVFSDRAFLSTAMLEERAFDGNVKIRVEGKSGVDISEVAQRGSGEAEVLFAPNTKFFVQEVRFDPSTGKWDVVLKEIK